MAKKIIKELIIVLLICLASILLLSLVLYEYVPMAKTIPNTVSYATPENVKQELNYDSSVDESQVVMTYEVDSTDLNNYKRIQGYKPGKANPFSSYDTSATSGTTNNATSGNTQEGNGTTNESNPSTGNTTSGNTSTETSGGHYFQDKGTK
jgi:hypothetical protein